MVKFFLATSLLLSAAAHAADHGHHHGQKNDQSTDQKNDRSSVAPEAKKPAKKFLADEALSKRMDLVTEAMMKLHESPSGGVTKQQLTEAGKKIESTVQDIFKSCKLAKDADMALHPILATLLDGAGSYKKGDEKKGHELVHKALEQYAEYFSK